MAFRCFARRHVVSPRRHGTQYRQPQQAARPICRDPAAEHWHSVAAGKARAEAGILSLGLQTASFSTSTAVRSEKAERDGRRSDSFAASVGGSSSGVWAQGTSRKSSSPFADRWRARESTLDNELGSPREDYTHPVTAALEAKTDSVGAHPSADDKEHIWSLYISALESTQQHMLSASEGTGTNNHVSFSAVPDIPVRLHRRVLRTLTPFELRKTFKERQREIVVNGNPSSSPALVPYQHNGVRDQTKQRRNIGTYLKRAGYILRHMNAADPAALPSIEDINVVFEQLAPTGDMRALSVIWAWLTGRPTLDSTFTLGHLQESNSQSGTKSDHAMATAKIRAPNRRTYIHLMVGIVRHLTKQLEDASKVDVSDAMGSDTSDLEKSWAAELNKSSGFNSNALRAIDLASKRTASLLDDMMQRRVPLTKVTCDLAMRIMRMSGNMNTLKLLTHSAYRLDLEHPDAIEHDSVKPEGMSDVGNPDIHVLNTLVMALGEYGTAGQMVALYEAMTKPITRKVILSQDDEEISSQGGQISSSRDDQIASSQDHEDGDAKVQQNFSPVSFFSLDWRWAFGKGDEPLGSLTSGPEEETVSESQTPEVPLQYAIMPNTTTMATMISNLCIAQKVPTVTHTDAQIGLARSARSPGRFKLSQAALVADRAHREDGGYVPLACSYLREAIELQERELNRIARELDVEMVSVDALVSAIEAIERGNESPPDDKIKEKSEHANQAQERLSRSERATETETDDRVHRVLGLQADCLGKTSEVQANKPFRPLFTPPSLHTGLPILQPLYFRGSQARDVARLSWLGTWSRRALALHIAEIQLMRNSLGKWQNELDLHSQAVRKGKTASPNRLAVEPMAIKELQDALVQNLYRVRRQARSLAYFHLEHITGRLVALRVRRRARAQRRKQAGRERLLQEQEAALARDEKKAHAQIMRKEDELLRREQEEKASVNEDGQTDSRAERLLQPAPLHPTS